VAFHVPEKNRIKTGPMGSTSAFGNNGAFALRLRNGHDLYVIASDGEGWEHVSVSARGKCPTWEQMCIVKSVFWDEEDCVIQYHPPKSEYVNLHPNCLHLWRPTLETIPRPPTWMIG
jgi:hypothetical protein